MKTTLTQKVDASELEQKVKKMYSDVALNPKGEYHFEMGRGLAEKLGYEKNDLDSIPAAAIDSFAGVGYYLDLANIKEGEHVLDMGSGSGMDVCCRIKSQSHRACFGADMTMKIEKIGTTAEENKFEVVSFTKPTLFHLKMLLLMWSSAMVLSILPRTKYLRSCTRAEAEGTNGNCRHYH
jgi:hypothetical protein